MAKSYDVPVPQNIKGYSANIQAANTNLDGSGTITTLCTAGSEGSLVRDLRAITCATQAAAIAVRLFWKPGGSGDTWKFKEEKLVPAYTVATTTAQAGGIFVDKTFPDAAISLPANAVLGATIAAAGNIQLNAEVVDF
jgi:hypothetical protein